ncbi:MAG: twin-arginine translocase subunit TatC [Bacteroidaceae bacterium]|nr:twin-arginine translocase subunit TatC [Bacteroidaceae bacterium]
MAAEAAMSFWEHLDVLRGVLWRCVLIVTVCAVAAFVAGDALFAAVLAPSHDSFAVYRLFETMGFPASGFHVDLINTGLARQFMLHVQVAGYAGLLCASPYILYALFRFASPGLYRHERRAALWACGGGYAMFLLGASVAYFLIFPLTFRFLGTYQVSTEIPNYITLDSYLDTLTTLCLLMGLMFELPVVCALLGRLGLLTAATMRRYRRHAVVIVLVAAAIITPTGDPFTLLVTSLPVLVLYEASVWVVGSGKN